MAADTTHHRAAGRIGAFRQHARHDAQATTAAGRSAFMRRFELEVDPDMVLSREDRQRRAGFARKAYFAALALSSARARRCRRKQSQRPGEGEE